jgi:hypothetical protein
MRHNFTCFLLNKKQKTNSANEKSHEISRVVGRLLYVSTDIELGVRLQLL